MVKIGKLNIVSPALAPMAGFTDSAFRRICREMGAGLVFSEMISAKALCFKDEKTASLLKFSDEERPFAIQLFGGEPDSMREAAKILSKYNPDLIDINMGCPVPKIVGSGSGSSLMRDFKRAGEVVRAVKEGSSVPVSVKMRIGWDKDSICGAEFAKMLEENGAELITVHGRTREQMYAPSVNIPAIAEVKKAVKIPVVANGDIVSKETAEKILEETGCDLVAVGRGALGNPFIFRELTGENYEKPSFLERMENLRRLCELEIENKGERLAFLELRRHLPFFFKGKRGAAELRRLGCSVNDRNDLENLISLAVNYSNQEE